MTDSNIKVSIIVLAQECGNPVEDCIESIADQSVSKDSYELILVNGGASTSLVNQHKERLNMNVLSLPPSCGFAEKYNRALSNAKGDVVLLLEQNVTLHHDCLQELLHTFELHTDAGAVLLNRRFSSKRPKNTSAENDYVGFHKLNRLGAFSYCTEETDRDGFPVDMIAGKAFGFRKAIIKDIKGYLFDIRLGSYLEEMDFALRLRKTDWKMFVSVKAVGVHDRHDSPQTKLRYRIGKLIHVSANRLLIHYNDLSRKQFLVGLPALLAGISWGSISGKPPFFAGVFRRILAVLLLPLILVFFALRVVAGAEAERENRKNGDTHIVKGKNRNTFFLLIVLSFFLISCFIYLRSMHWEFIYDIVHSLNYLAAFFSLFFLFYMVGALRFKVVFRRLGYSTSIRALLPAVFASQFSASVTPFGSGQLLIAPFLRQRFSIPFGTTALFLGVDRVLAFFLWIMFSLLGILGAVVFRQNSIFWVGSVCLLIGAGWIYFFLVRVFDDSIHRFGIPKYGGNVLHLIGRDPIIQTTEYATLLVRYGIMIVQFMLVVQYLGWRISFADSLMIISLSFVSGLLTMLPMGLFGRDAVMISLSSYAGIPLNVSLGVVLLFRSVLSLPRIIFGTLCGVWLTRRYFEKK